MSEILVVCFSRSGSTEQAARDLAARLGADLGLVRPLASYAGRGGFLKGVLQSLMRATPAISYDRAPSSYGLVVVAAPVWAGRLAAPMRSYLMRHGAQIRSVAAFSVSGRGGAFDAFFDEIGRLCGRAPEPRLGLAERSVLDGTAEGQIETFAAAIRERLPPSRRVHSAA